MVEVDSVLAERSPEPAMVAEPAPPAASDAGRARGAVELRGLTKRYSEETVVDALAVSIAPGEFFSLLGPSGSGKTTTLMMVAGFVRPDGGTVLLDGADIAAVPPQRRGFGMVFQNYAIFPHLNVFENIAFPMREHTDLPEELIRDLVLMKLHAVGLRGAAQLMPAELSGGMARRVALARAIALDPMLVMYDEPFAGLDPISLGVIGQLIRKLNDLRLPLRDGE